MSHLTLAKALNERFKGSERAQELLRTMREARLPGEQREISPEFLAAKRELKAIMRPFVGELLEDIIAAQRKKLKPGVKY